MSADYYRQAVDAAVASLDKPLADLTEAEKEALADRAVGYLIEWDVFREDSYGAIRGGSVLRGESLDYVPLDPSDVPF